MSPSNGRHTERERERARGQEKALNLIKLTFLQRKNIELYLALYMRAHTQRSKVVVRMYGTTRLKHIANFKMFFSIDMFSSVAASAAVVCVYFTKFDTHKAKAMERRTTFMLFTKHYTGEKAKKNPINSKCMAYARSLFFGKHFQFCLAIRAKCVGYTNNQCNISIYLIC